MSIYHGGCVHKDLVQPELKGNEAYDAKPFDVRCLFFACISTSQHRRSYSIHGLSQLLYRLARRLPMR
jgi:hypothetical protein